MSKPLPAPPSRRPVEPLDPVPGAKFSQVREGHKVQFNKRVERGVADGFEMLAIKTRRKVPELLGEALELLQERYGKI
jgi:hypothetical protein